MKCLKKQKVILAVLLLLLTSLLAISGSMPIIQTVETFFNVHSHTHSHKNGKRPHHHSFGFKRSITKPPSIPGKPDATIQPISQPGTPGTPGTPDATIQPIPETPVPETSGCLSKKIDLNTLRRSKQRELCNNPIIKQQLDEENNKGCLDKEFRYKNRVYNMKCSRYTPPSGTPSNNKGCLSKEINFKRLQSLNPSYLCSNTDIERKLDRKYNQGCKNNRRDLIDYNKKMSVYNAKCRRFRAQPISRK